MIKLTLRACIPALVCVAFGLGCGSDKKPELYEGTGATNVEPAKAPVQMKLPEKN